MGPRTFMHTEPEDISHDKTISRIPQNSSTHVHHKKMRLGTISLHGFHSVNNVQLELESDSYSSFVSSFLVSLMGMGAVRKVLKVHDFMLIHG
jgi:hypothetical protein